jgi:hypothetical protein
LLHNGQAIFTQVIDRDSRAGSKTEILNPFISSGSFQEIQYTGERYELFSFSLIDVSYQLAGLEVLIDGTTSITQDFQEWV